MNEVLYTVLGFSLGFISTITCLSFLIAAIVNKKDLERGDEEWI